MCCLLPAVFHLIAFHHAIVVLTPYTKSDDCLGIGEIFKLTVSLGGTLSGEHGIGIAKRPYMSIAMSEANLAVMRGIKKVFDPDGILNPGKIF